ncbi:cardiolipin synthase [Shewanella sp. AS16]|uniref:cardiolipin synthase n=1 Tax=Shewanella sp. AS16 TaxID=2907625 RepID=UPI001F440EE9|nr:cardiolipin synthase [Shewanella sp. AS16]MCE9687240.1 cardiolipin synthase [Shewanella sp. AS16]
MEQVYHAITLLWFNVYWFAVAAITLRVVFKRRAIGVSFAWLMIIYVLPLVGILAYLMFGELNLGRKRAKRAKQTFGPYARWFRRAYRDCLPDAEALRPYGKSISALCERQLGIPALSGHRLSLQSIPAQILTQLVEDIATAQHSIHIEFYIWYPGGLADKVADALCQAAARGVSIKLLLDAAGSREFFDSQWPTALSDAGVEVVAALNVSPFRMFFQRLDLRLHRKIVVIDNLIAYTGSMNLVDPDYFKVGANIGKWVDIMVRIAGPAVSVLDCIHAWDWENETQERHFTTPPAPPSCPAVAPLDVVQVIPSGPGMPEEIIHQALLQSIYQARKSIVITTPYLVPSELLLFALESAARRGIRLDIIVPGRNDSLMVEWASRAFFGELLSAGVRLHRYNGGMLHTKSVVIDDTHCLVGTVNLDMRSLWLNFEVTLAIDDPIFTEQLSQLQLSYLENTTEIDARQWRQRPLLKRLFEQFFYLFSPLL